MNISLVCEHCKPPWKVFLGIMMMWYYWYINTASARQPLDVVAVIHSWAHKNVWWGQCKPGFSCCVCVCLVIPQNGTKILSKLAYQVLKHASILNFTHILFTALSRLYILFCYLTKHLDYHNIFLFYHPLPVLRLFCLTGTQIKCLLKLKNYGDILNCLF